MPQNNFGQVDFDLDNENDSPFTNINLSGYGDISNVASGVASGTGTSFDYDMTSPVGFESFGQKKTSQAIKEIQDQTARDRIRFDSQIRNLIKKNTEIEKSLEKSNGSISKVNDDVKLAEKNAKNIYANVISVLALFSIVSTLITSEIKFLTLAEDITAATNITIILFVSMSVFAALIFLFLEMFRFSFENWKSSVPKIVIYLLVIILSFLLISRVILPRSFNDDSEKVQEQVVGDEEKTSEGESVQDNLLE
jgi:hypothetical protein